MSARPFLTSAFVDRLLFLLFAACCLSSSLAEFCHEENSLPYHLNISADGELHLTCARLSCFFGGNGADDQLEAMNETLKSDEYDSKTNQSSSKTICRSSSWSSSCSAEGHGWFGGSTSFSKMKKCCYNEKLRPYNVHSQRLIHFGEDFIGGPVLRNGRQVAFNFISNARKLNDGQNRSKYLVVMSRIACLPEPLQLTNDVEDGLEDELFAKIEQQNKAETANARIHGVDTDSKLFKVEN
uniref:Uncharacterized protein n=1 Tax=Plectus sambesii TaxID=2011161 RepID=A0A914VJK0_9BILA